MAEFENGYCTGCGYKVRRWGHRPFCWRRVTMMLDVDPSHKFRQRLLKEMNRHWRIRSLFLAKKRHMYFQYGDDPYPSEQGAAQL
jgi:predicted amidophosphoribosyltransferase